MLLAIDTATEYAGLALYTADTVLAEDMFFAGRNHTVSLAEHIEHLLAQADITPANLSGIAVCIGPGSYTGVRIGVSMAKGLALSKQLPVVGVQTLDIVAYPHQNQNLPVLAIVRAGRKRIIAAQYAWQDKLWQATRPAHITTFIELAAVLTESVFVTGEIIAAEADILRQNAPVNLKIASPMARVRRPAALAELGFAALAAGKPSTLSALSPIYLKSPGA